MIEGTLIAESIRAGAELGGVRLVTREIRRSPQGDVPAGQPEVWTLIEFEAEEPDAAILADALAKVLDAEHGWYADFRSVTRRSSFTRAGSSAIREGTAEDGLKPWHTGALWAFPRMNSTGRSRHAPAEASGRCRGRSLGYRVPLSRRTMIRPLDRSTFCRATT